MASDGSMVDAFYELAVCLTNHDKIKDIAKQPGVNLAIKNGIESAMEAYVAGVPIDDIMA